MKTNATSSTPETTRRPIVCALAQPFVGASTTAYTSSVSAPVIVSAPAGSKLRATESSRLSWRSTGQSASAATPTGMLMKKIHCQPGPETSGPPS